MVNRLRRALRLSTFIISELFNHLSPLSHLLVRSFLFDIVRVLNLRDPFIGEYASHGAERITTMNSKTRTADRKQQTISKSKMLSPKRQLRPDEIAAIDRLAREWRTQWRNEKAADQIDAIAESPANHRKNAKHRARFAEGMAREEFGKNYRDPPAMRRTKHLSMTITQTAVKRLAIYA
jgi:hypothetical protein